MFRKEHVCFTAVVAFKAEVTNYMEQRLFEKLTVTQIVKKFPAFYENQKFITECTTARHWILS
jgi:hypothetical protein